MLVLFSYRQYKLDLITINENRDEMGQVESMVDKPHLYLLLLSPCCHYRIPSQVWGQWRKEDGEQLLVLVTVLCVLLFNPYTPLDSWTLSLIPHFLFEAFFSGTFLFITSTSYYIIDFKKEQCDVDVNFPYLEKFCLLRLSNILT